jgi:flagellar assembly factor FliW
MPSMEVGRMKIDSTRFGTLDLDDNAQICFPHGIVGFPNERCFVLLRRRPTSAVGWLQSTMNPALAFPVVSLDALEIEYPDHSIEQAAAESGISNTIESIAVMAVVSAPGGGAPATVNLLSPIIVNADTRTGAQVLLEKSRYSTQEPFVMRQAERPISNRQPSTAEATP